MRVGERVGYHVDTLTAAVLVRAASPVTLDTLVIALNEYSRERIRQTIDQLVAAGFLATDRRAEHQALRDELAEWMACGWEAAAQYHFQTYGYEFETYDKNGASQEDARRMRGYAAERTDTDRSKSYGAVALETRPLPLPLPNLAPESVVAAVGLQRPLSADGLGELMSLLACPVQEVQLPWPGAAPALRKTSPSGGSRHPTEVYLHVVDIDGLTDGWWHVAAQKHRLERISGTAPRSDMEATVHFQTAAGPRALVLYTSVFARNRYRYREPRTFRTVHMDIGHMMGTCEFLAVSRGLNATPITQIDAAAFATALGLDPLVECPIAASVLYGGPSA